MISWLATDAYKFSMAQAGWPLRLETFYYSHRKGGLQYLPFDVQKIIETLRPAWIRSDEAFLAGHGYEASQAFADALKAPLHIEALPAHCWFLPREPIFSLTGPSALVSWLEPLALQLNFRIQVATAAKRGEPVATKVTCQREKEIILETLDSIGVTPPKIEVAALEYQERVKAQGLALTAEVSDPARLFEVGLRSATCVEQHLLALQALKDIGLTSTSHVWGAQQLGLTAVGTMGHEHVQRYGDDELAFRALVERRSGSASFLLDTFDTLTSGLPAALRVMSERTKSVDSIRYDSGDKEMQYRKAEGLAQERGLNFTHILEDGFDVLQTRTFESLRRALGVKSERQRYGYGGFLVAQTGFSVFQRDAVAAVYKLSQTGERATMKFGNETGMGKQSIPGRPVVFRRLSETPNDRPYGIVGQHGETPPAGYGQPSSETNAPTLTFEEQNLEYSEQTHMLMRTLKTREKS
jgi:nicotinate phosphoribosyltransferase